MDSREPLRSHFSGSPQCPASARHGVAAKDLPRSELGDVALGLGGAMRRCDFGRTAKRECRVSLRVGRLPNPEHNPSSGMECGFP